MCITHPSQLIPFTTFLGTRTWSNHTIPSHKQQEIIDQMHKWIYMQDQDSNNEITNTIISINVHLQQAKQKWSQINNNFFYYRYRNCWGKKRRKLISFQKVINGEKFKTWLRCFNINVNMETKTMENNTMNTIIRLKLKTSVC